MRPRSHSRHIPLFLAAILVPCLLLVALSVRIIRQERELAEKRLAEDRGKRLVQLQQELLARLESIKLQEVNSMARGGTEHHPAVAMVGRLEANRLVLPWEHNRAAEEFRSRINEPGFAEKIQQGEREELVARQPARAAERYREAVEGARHPAQAANARLLLGRALAKTDRRPEALAEYRKILALDSIVADEHGVPLALYAAERLLQAGAAREAVLERVRAELDRSGWQPPGHAYMLRDLVQTLGARELMDQIEQRLRHLNQALALQRDFSQLPVRAGQPVWAPYGEELWLVSVAAPLGTLEAAVVAVRADAVSETRLLAARNADGDALGDGFPGLKAALERQDDTAAARQFKLLRWFYFTALGLVLAVTLFGGWLLWRDVRREMRMAETRAQFVSSVSHELKTPLTAIRMFAETLRLGRSSDPRAQEEYLETIVNESERLTRLVDNVLDFSKIEQGKKIYHPQPTSLSEVVGAAARAMQYPLAQQGFQLRVEVEDGLPPVEADRDSIEQAILNLLANAMKYSGQAREIGLRLRRDNGSAVIEVADRGVGIGIEEQERIFDKYYRVQTSENQLVPGTGLGLTLVAHTAKAHGGEVRVRSTPGEGSTFEIHLPLENGA